jgi:hypothetical protein
MGRAPVTGALAASAALVAGFIVWEHRRTDPMLPMSFFRRRRYSAAIASLALVIIATEMTWARHQQVPGPRMGSSL